MAVGLLNALAPVVAANPPALPAAAPAMESAAASDADPIPPPWHRGVTDRQRAIAQNLVDRGNELFLESKHREALAEYLAARAVWDHPAICFNIARSLIQLDRPVDAFTQLQCALAYGSAPLQEQVFVEARSYEHLLRGQVAELRVLCSQRDVRVSIDGEVSFNCPGARTTYVAPGHHQIVGEKPGFLPFTRSALALSGNTADVEVSLVSIRDAQAQTRWPAWLPWTTVGAGAVFGATGIALRLQAEAHLDRYAEALRRECGEAGCAPDQLPAQDLRYRARVENGFAVASFVLGGGLVVSGVVLALLNRPVLVEDTGVEPAPGIVVVPLVSGNFLGATFEHRF
jgi:hypothetical protein